MAYNLVPTTSHVMGGNFLVPTTNSVMASNFVVSPAVKPLMSNFVISPANAIIGGNLVVPTNNHLIAAPGNYFIGSNFAVPAPGSTVIGGGGLAMPYVRNMVPDHSRKTIDSVEHLSRRYEGILRCKKCQTSIALVGNAVVAHEQQCAAAAGVRNATNILQKNASMSNSTEFRTLSIVDAFKQFVKAYPADGRNAVVSPPSLEWMSTLMAQVDRTSFIISHYECLVCGMSDMIAEWEKHVLNMHTDVSQACVDDEQQFQITCICFLCNCLLHGTQKSIRKHIHRSVDASRCVNMCHSLAIYPSLPGNDVTLSRYQKFALKTAVQPPSRTNVDEYNVKIAFYCAACDFYGLKKVDKHFSSFEHKMRAVVSDELRQCEICQLVLSSDALLMAVHRLTPSHLQQKAKGTGSKTLDCWTETDAHRTLMESIQQRLSELKMDSISQRMGFFCDVCDYWTLQLDKWRTHKTCETHRTNLADHNAALPVEFECMTCKVTLFGAIRAYLGHSSTKGHCLVKRTLVNRRNLQLLAQETPQKPGSSSQQAVREAAASGTNVVSNPSHLSDLLYSVLVSKNDDEKRKPNAVVGQSHQRTLSESHAHKERSDSETGRSSTTVNRKGKQRAAQRKVRSESESSVVSQLKSVATTNAYTVDSSATTAVEHAAPEIEPEAKAEQKPRPSRIAGRHSDSECGGRPATSNAGVAARTAANASMRSLSATPALTSDGEKSDADESDHDCFYDCNDADEGASSSSHVASENDDVKAALDSDEDDDDENDIYDAMLAPDENDVNVMLSDEELDATVRMELENDAANGPGPANDAENAAANDDNREIVRHLIVVRGIPKQALKNKRFMYTTFSKYGEIHRTYVKKNEPDSLYILVLKNPEGTYQSLKDNILNLKEKFGAEEINVEYNTRSSNGPAIRMTLSKEAQILFSNAKEFEEAVHCLMQTYENELKSSQSRAKIYNLEKTIAEMAMNLYNNTKLVKVHIFGSRVTGLATEKSDVDMYLQLESSFCGSIHTNTVLQQRLVLLFANKMKMHPKQFQNVISVPFARVPIVKFKDVSSDLNCDLSFKSGLSTMNSILVRTYLKLDVRVRYLICAVKLWMKLNSFADRHLFTTYAQIWMVLFFLMQAEIAVIPTVLQLRYQLPSQQQEFIIEGWNCAFPHISGVIWRSACKLSKEELLMKFFEFYSDVDLKNYVLCTLTGIRIQKKHFLKYFDSLPLIFRQYKFKVRTDADLFSRIMYDFEGLCVQDPFDHSHNLTKTINSRKFMSLADVCREMVAILKQN